MKRLLLVVSAFILVFALAACKPGEDIVETLLESVALSGLTDIEIMEDDVIDLLDGVVATGDDNLDYSSLITVASDDCTITDGVLDTSTPGTCTIVYSVVVLGKIARESITITITPTPIEGGSDIVVMGWDFEEEADLDNWDIYVAGAGSIVKSIEDGAMKLVTTSGGQRFETRLDYMGVNLELNEVYTVTFKMKSDIDGKKVHLNFGELLPSDPWFTPFKPEGIDIITLTTEFQTFTYSFLMELDNQAGGPLLEMGNLEGSEGIDATIWVDDFVITGGSGEDTSAPSFSGVEDVVVPLGSMWTVLDGVTAMDAVDGDLTANIGIAGDVVDTSVAGVYNVRYIIWDAAFNNKTHMRQITVVEFVDDAKNDMVNDIFAADAVIGNVETDTWYTSVSWGEPIFTANSTAGKLVISSAKDGDKAYGTNFWDHIVRYTDFRLIKGVDYLVTFDGMTDEVGNTTNNMMVKVEAEGFAAEKQFMLTETSNANEFVFTYTGETTLNAALLFFVGGREHVITIDNIDVMISKAGSELVNVPFFTGLDEVKVDTGDMEFSLLEGVMAGDLEDGEIALLEANVTVLGPNGETAWDSEVDGMWVITYTVMDADSNETVMTRNVEVTSRIWNPTNIITNGNFQNGAWEVYGAYWESTNFSYSVENETIVFDITDAGAANWNIQLIQYDLDLVVGKTYRLTMDVNATVGRDITPKLIHSAEIQETVTLAVGDNAVVVDFVYDGTEDAVGKLSIELGKINDPAASVLTFDNIMLEEYDGSAVVASTDQIVNGDFTETTMFEAWATWSHNGNETFNIEYNEGVLRYDDPSDAAWKAKLEQSGIVFEEGKTYRLLFDAKGNEARDFQVSFWDGSVGFESGALALGTDFAAYEFIFTYDSANAATLEFQLGKLTENFAGNTFYVNNIRIEEELQKDEVIFLNSHSITNGMFDANAWYLWAADWNATAVTVDFNGTAAVLDITNPGEQNWNVQLNQENLVLKAAQAYTVTLDVTSTVEREINVKLIAGGAEYFEVITVTPTTTTYVVQIAYAGAAVTDGKLSLEMGGVVDAVLAVTPASMVTVDDVMIEEYDGSAVVADTDVIVNGDFAINNRNGWATWSEAGNETLAVMGNVAVLSYVTPGDASYKTKLEQAGIMLEEGGVYMLSFDAKGSHARDFQVSFWDGSMGFESGVLELGTDFAHYEFEFVYTSANSATLEFQLGQLTANFEGTDFYVDNVVIEKRHVKAELTFVEVDVLDSPNFDNGYWEVYGSYWKSTDFSYEVNGDGQLELDIANLGDANWDIQLVQEGINFVVGKTYRVTFDASSSVARDIRVKLIHASELEMDQALTDTMTTYTLDFVYDGTADAAGKLSIELGLINSAVASIIKIDNVMVEEYDGSAVVASTDQIMNGMFDEFVFDGWATWSHNGGESFNIEYKEGVLRYDDAGDASWKVKLEAGGLVLEENAVYMFEFDAKGTDARDFQVSFWDGSMGFESGVLELGTDFAHYSYIFTYTSGNSATLEFQLGKLTDNFAGDTFWVNNVKISKLDMN